MKRYGERHLKSECVLENGGGHSRWKCETWRGGCVLKLKVMWCMSLRCFLSTSSPHPLKSWYQLLKPLLCKRAKVKSSSHLLCIAFCLLFPSIPAGTVPSQSVHTRRLGSHHKDPNCLKTIIRSTTSLMFQRYHAEVSHTVCSPTLHHPFLSLFQGNKFIFVSLFSMWNNINFIYISKSLRFCPSTSKISIVSPKIIPGGSY